MYSPEKIAAIKEAAELIGKTRAAQRHNVSRSLVRRICSPKYKRRAQHLRHRGRPAPAQLPPQHVLRRRVLIKRLQRRVTTKGDRAWRTCSTASQFQQALEKEFDIKVSVATVKRDLKASGMRSLVRNRVPTRMRVEITKRKTFVRLMKKKGIRNTNILSSDEVIFSCMEKGDRTEYVYRGQAPFPREGKARRNYPTVTVWCAIGTGWKSDIVIFPQTKTDEEGDSKRFYVDGAAYRRRCLGTVSAYLEAHKKNKFLLQDGAKPHTAKATLEYFQRKALQFVQLPPYSPDFNPIELVWKDMHYLISKKAPVTLGELTVAVKEAWAEIPQRKINRYLRHWNTKVLGEQSSRKKKK
jgi:transposase